MTDAPRQPAQRYEEFIDWLDGKIIARHDWLNSHGGSKRWPQSDIDSKQRGLVIMQAMRAHFAELVGTPTDGQRSLF